MHPQYQLTPAENRWSGGSLRSLFELLDREAKKLAGKQQWRCLPSGALVSLQYDGAGIRRMRIVRTEVPKTDRGPHLFRTEVDTFVREFAIAHWIRGPHPSDPRVGIGAILVEPRVNSGHFILCNRCGVELVMREDAYPPAGHHCTNCAFAAGRETAERIRQELIPHGITGATA